MSSPPSLLPSLLLWLVVACARGPIDDPPTQGDESAVGDGAGGPVHGGAERSSADGESVVAQGRTLDDASVDGALTSTCAPFAAACLQAVALGDLIGTQRDVVSGFAAARKELEHHGSGSGFVKVRVVDEFDAFGDFDFDNLVGAKITLSGQAEARYELRVTGGATSACAQPYPGHVVRTDGGVADLTTVFGRYMGMPPLTGSHVNDFGDLVIEIVQLEGPCDAPFVLQVSGHPCSSSCAWNGANPCRQQRQPKTCDEVTD
jgi:hypothetical protein